MFKIMLKARQGRVRLVIGQNLKTPTWGWKYGISTRTSPETEPCVCLLLDATYLGPGRQRESLDVLTVDHDLRVEWLLFSKMRICVATTTRLPRIVLRYACAGRHVAAALWNGQTSQRRERPTIPI
jgi:hypothetical protein